MSAAGGKRAGRGMLDGEKERGRELIAEFAPSIFFRCLRPIELSPRKIQSFRLSRKMCE